MTPGIAVVIATLGRPTLEDTLRSIVGQGLTAADRIVVVRDSHGDAEDTSDVRGRLAAFAPHVTYLEHDAGQHYYGGTAQSNAGFGLVHPDQVLLSIGDDDVYVDGAFDRIRPLIAEDPDRPVLFQVLVPWRQVVPSRRRVKRHAINGSGIAARRSHFGDFPLSGIPSADFDWLTGAIAKSGKVPAWIDDVLVICKPERRNGQLATQGVTYCALCHQVRFREDVDADGVCALHQAVAV